MTAYRGDHTEADALAAIMQHRVDDPDGAYSVRQYPDGFYILAVRSAGEAWLTETSNG